MTTHGNQTLIISNLQLNAYLGILNHEKLSSQRISIDVEINRGLQPLLPINDDIDNVLDYRLVHDAIVAVCQQSHTLLLESLTGKVCVALLAITGVLGARVKVSKLEIFDDCVVSVAQQVGIMEGGV